MIPLQQKWIKIKDEFTLPKTNTKIIVSNCDEIYYAFLTLGGFWNVDGQLFSPGYFNYWIPIPTK